MLPFETWGTLDMVAKEVTSAVNKRSNIHLNPPWPLQTQSKRSYHS